MKLLSNLYYKFFKKRSTNDDEAMAYANMGITKDNNVVLTGDFKPGRESDMAKIVFLFASGSLGEIMAKVVIEKCGKDSYLTKRILSEAEFLMRGYIAKHMNDQGQDNDDEPVVDPCNVFKHSNKEHMQ